MIERDLETGWIAGFLDGDGCFGWYGESSKRKENQRKRWIGYPQVSASQNDIEPLNRIAKRFPGTVRYIETHENGKDRYEYRVNNKVAIDIMVEIYPLMSTRRKETIMKVIANYTSREAERLEDGLFCSNGHPRTKRNTYIYPVGTVYEGQRRCRVCSREEARRNAKVAALV